jgi:hypothetical protein
MPFSMNNLSPTLYRIPWFFVELPRQQQTAVFDAYIDFIKEGNYIRGRGDGTG